MKLTMKSEVTQMKKSSRLMTVILALTLVAGVSLTACSSGGSGTSSAAAPTAPAASSGAAGTENTAASTDYPKNAIQIICPYSAGGNTDLMARIIEMKLPEYLPNSVSIATVNVPGGSYIPGMTEVYTAEPDGYTIACIAGSPLSIVPAMGETEYTHDSFTAIAMITSFANVIAVKADSPINTAQEMIDYVKANPGQFTYGVGGATNTPNLAISSLVMEEELDMKSVVYNGNSEVLTAFLGGHVDAYAGASTDIRAYVESGEAKIILNLGTVKEDYYADAATMGDLGYVAVGDSYTGFVAPPDTPDEIVLILETAIKEILENEEVITTLSDMGLQPQFLDHTEFQKLISEYYLRNAEILNFLGLAG